MASRKLDIEKIYEALVDDERFAALPGEIAASLGARSVLMHWHFADGSADILGLGTWRFVLDKAARRFPEGK